MAEEKRRRVRVGFLAAAALVVIGIAVAPYFIGPPGTPLEFPPDELLGTWSTNEPRYADRTMTFTTDQLVMGLGSEGRRVYDIESILVEVAEVHREYTISYSDADGEQSMDLFVYDDGLLRLRNPSEVRWTRTGR